jgi:hypothetical protein
MISSCVEVLRARKPILLRVSELMWRRPEEKMSNNKRLSKTRHPDKTRLNTSSEIETYSRVSCLRRGKITDVVIWLGKLHPPILTTRRVGANRSTDDGKGKVIS